jgi:hypothetical protein
MNEKIIDYSKYLDNKKVIIKIDQNQFIFFKKEEIKKNIIGFYTDGVISCSVICILFNDESCIFFSHIDEKSNIFEVIENIANRLNKAIIKKVDIIYSKGPRLNNNKNNVINQLDYDKVIGDIINILKKYFNKNNELVITKTTKDHVDSISCLKIVKPEIGERHYLNELKDLTINKIKNCITAKTGKNLKDLILKKIDDFENVIDYKFNIIYYYDIISLKNLLSILDVCLKI